MRATLSILLGFAIFFFASTTFAGIYAPAAGQPGSDAISKDDARIFEWATSVTELSPGPVDISNPGLGVASFGAAANALGKAQGTSTNVVSLGDGGHITLAFDKPITNGPGADLAVFENGFSDTFLELGFVEVSSNGSNFFRFPSISQTPTATQVGGFGALDPTNLYDLAGKYRQGYGTPFDLAELAGVSPLLDVTAVRFVRVVDVVGSINPLYATHDSLGNIVNDPWTTPTSSGGFDLDAIGAINVVPEPATLALAAIAIIACVMAKMLRDRPSQPEA